MKLVTESCCGTKKRKGPDDAPPEIPGQIQKELEAMGGFETLTSRLPDSTVLEKKSRVYHALADPLRLTILYLIKDQPLCVCVINRFTRISGSKLSYHLNILKESGLVESEYQGNWIIYSLTESGRGFVS